MLSVFVVGWVGKFIYTNHPTTKIATELCRPMFSDTHKKGDSQKESPAIAWPICTKKSD
jgi:hypothetical protein